MTRVDLEAVERMLDEATPGPWHVNLPGIEDDIRDGNGGYVATAFGAHNATLIAAAPTLIRALIEEVRGLERDLRMRPEISVRDVMLWQSGASSATRDSAWMRIVDALDAFTLDYEPSDDEIEAARSR